MQPSIDAFVEQRHEFLEVGKAAIATTLIPHENQHVLERRDSPMQWYEHLFHQLGPSIDDIQNSNLTVVTFNYDRSLEYFLYNAIARAFGLEAERTYSLYSRNRIIHLHGDLGSPHFSPTPGRAYSPAVDLPSLRTAMARIIIPGAENVDPSPFQQSQLAINNAEVLCFLGFAFHSANLERLAIQPVDHRSAYVCAFHLPRNAVSRARAAVNGIVSVGEFEEGILSFLQDNPIFE